MNTVSHIRHGLWRHPEARQADFNEVEVWIELVKTLEAGLFDAAFFADVVGLYGLVNGDYTVNVREGLQIPSNDPSVLLSALAVNTQHLGLAFTSSVLQAHPFEFARRASTLDHISKGRVAWNIVTSTQENAARNFGFERLTEHDERYEWAQEYLDVVFKLWEGSWDEGALLKDRDGGVLSDPRRIHKIHHVGKRYRVEGAHLPSPRPQRTGHYDLGPAEQRGRGPRPARPGAGGRHQLRNSGDLTEAHDRRRRKRRGRRSRAFFFGGCRSNRSGAPALGQGKSTLRTRQAVMVA
jgi:FMN-dependent oxidoreductase (nitrilotriacetate monooxygenase family)